MAQKPSPAANRKAANRVALGCVLAVVAFVVFLVVSIAISAHGTASQSTTSSDTPTAQADLTVDQQITQTVQGVSALGQGVTSAYSSSDQSVTINETTQGGFTNGDSVNIIKLDCYSFQKALWTSSAASAITSVELQVNGQFTDKFGHASTGIWGSCTLTASTAKQFVWANLDENGAWSDYDTTYLTPSLLN